MTGERGKDEGGVREGGGREGRMRERRRRERRMRGRRGRRRREEGGGRRKGGKGKKEEGRMRERLQLLAIRTYFSLSSIKLFVGQYHIWLANDTKGILVLIPNQPVLNAVITTFVFVCACHEVSKVTTVLAGALVAKDVRVMLRRLVIFIIMLFIIWWHKTHNYKGKIH
jgi:hypothetical protein